MEVGSYILHFFPMTSPFGLCEQLIVFDERHKQFRTVRVDGEWMEEENGRRYHRRYSPYEMWAPIARSNTVWTTS